VDQSEHQHSLEAQLGALLARIRAQLQTPGEASLQEVLACEQALRQIPAGVVSATRVECLLAISQHYYLAARPASALPAADRAVDVARALGDRSLLRKALTFLGVMRMETGNLPEATGCFSEALEIAQQLGDAGAEAPVWNNLGLALQNAAQYTDAIHCFEQAAALAERCPAFGFVRRSALSNIASCALHLHDVRTGIKAVRQAIELNPDPQTPTECLSRVISESNYARLLLEVGETGHAAEHCEKARIYAAKAPTARAEFAASLTSGLIDVHSGRVDVGLSRLQQVLDETRQHVRSEIRDALVALVKAYDIAGQPKQALVYLRELLHYTRRTQIEGVVRHQRLHLQRLQQTGEHADPAAAPEPADCTAPLSAAARSRIEAQLALLHQQAVVAELAEDPSGEHVYRVGKLAALLAAETGCDEDTCFMVEMAARLHDVGKLGIPPALLARRGRINPDQMALVRTHAAIGAELLAQSGLPHLQMIVDVARHHHERWDGSGYPDGIAGQAIPEAARIVALADVFDVLTHARPWRGPLPVARALEKIEQLKATHFDPRLADLLVALVRRLQREVGDLDEHLGAAARASPFIRARRRIAEASRPDADPG
jgi:putative two-component system response regulator